MTDSSIGNIISETMDSTESVEAKPEAVVEPQKVETPTEQPQQEESFAEKGELKGKTPEELEETYQNWNKAYQAKRQKETAELKAMREELDRLKSAQAAKPQSQMTTEQKADEAKRQVEIGNMTIPEYTEYMKTLIKEEARQTTREEIETIESEKLETSLADKAKDDFEKADPRFDETSPLYDEVMKTDVRRELADLLDDHLAQFGSYKGFDAAKLAKEIIKRRDERQDEIIKKRTQESTQAAKMRDAKLRKSETRGTTSDSQKIGGDSIKDILSETIDSMA